MRCLFYLGLAFCFAAAFDDEKAYIYDEKEDKLKVSCFMCHDFAEAVEGSCQLIRCRDIWGRDRAPCEQACKKKKLELFVVCDRICPPMIRTLCKAIKTCKDQGRAALCSEKDKKSGGILCQIVFKNNDCNTPCIDWTCIKKGDTEKHC